MSTALREIYLLLLQSGHGHWSHPQPVHSRRSGGAREDASQPPDKRPHARTPTHC